MESFIQVHSSRWLVSFIHVHSSRWFVGGVRGGWYPSFKFIRVGGWYPSFKFIQVGGVRAGWYPSFKFISSWCCLVLHCTSCKLIGHQFVSSVQCNRFLVRGRGGVGPACEKAGRQGESKRIVVVPSHSHLSPINYSHGGASSGCEPLPGTYHFWGKFREPLPGGGEDPSGESPTGSNCLQPACSTPGELSFTVP